MSEHNDIGTPGPWQFQGLKSGEYEICGTEYLDKIALCSAVAMAYTQPDAALIAAAPDLLQALQEMVRIWEGPRDRAAVGFAAAVVQARAALSKAKVTA